MAKSKDLLICELQYALDNAEKTLKKIRVNECIKNKTYTPIELVNKYFKNKRNL